VCLRLTGQLCDGTAGALAAAVGDRVRAVMPPACAVVLDVSAIPDVDDAVQAALLSLCDILSESRTRLWLVVPKAEARARLCRGTASPIGLNALHTSVRAAILAAHAALPGPALVTPAMRALLTQPPEPLTLLSDPG
jgi:anti-anti-sigma regulatory factor